MSDLDEVANAWEAQRGRRERARAAWVAGIRTSPDLVRLADREPMLADPESFLLAREALASAPEDRRPALGRLAAGIAEWLTFVRSAAAEARVRESLSGATVRLEAEVLLLSDAEVDLASCLDPARRKALARGVVETRGGLDSQQDEVVQRRLEMLARLECHSDAAWGALWSLDFAALAASAETLLRDSEGPYLEALDFRLRRERLDAHAGEAGRAELEIALELCSLREHLSPGQLDFAANGWAEGLGLDRRGAGRIALDAEARSGRFRSVLVAPFAVPGEIAAVVTPLGTPADLDRRLQVIGSAWHWAGIDPERSISERTDIDPARPLASGAAISAIVTTPEWHQRCLRVASRVADELARAFALRHLAALRGAAASFLVSLELRARGPSPSLRDAYRERLGRALGGDWGPVGWLDIDPLDPATELRGRAEAIAVGRDLEERFNDDWWRNPHAGEFFRHQWSQGGALPTVTPDLNVAWRVLAERAVG